MKLKQKLVLLFILIALLPYVVGMVIITLASSTTIKENAQGFFYQYTQNKAKDIATFFSEEKEIGRAHV